MEATLVLDTRRHEPALGPRGARSVERRLLYRAPSALVELRLPPTLGPDGEAWVFGQYLGAPGRAEPCPFRVTLRDEEGGTREAVPLWNDKRTGDLVAEFEARFADSDYLGDCANPATPAWPGFKLQWIRDNDAEAYRRAAAVKVVFRVQLGVTEKFEGGAVQLVGAALGLDVHLRNGAPIFGLKESGFDLKLLKSLNRGQQQIRVEVGVGVFDSIQREMIEVHSLSGDVQRELVARSAHSLLALR